MNNCYGKTGDMQKVLVRAIRENNEELYLSICISDTDDTESQREEINAWIDRYSVKGSIKSWDFVEGVQTVPKTHEEYPMDMEDGDENEMTVYMLDPEDIWEVIDYDALHNICIPF